MQSLSLQVTTEQQAKKVSFSLQRRKRIPTSRRPLLSVSEDHHLRLFLPNPDCHTNSTIRLICAAVSCIFFFGAIPTMLRDYFLFWAQGSLLEVLKVSGLNFGQLCTKQVPYLILSFWSVCWCFSKYSQLETQGFLPGLPGYGWLIVHS